jgi:hypothetical protein
MLEPNIHLVLDRLSNDEYDKVNVEQSWIDEAGEAFKDALQRQLTDTGKNDFRLRMSNVGRPLCQLQMAASGAKPSRKPYNFKMQMMIGDAVECLTDVLLKIAGTNITGGKDQVELEVAGVTIKAPTTLKSTTWFLTSKPAHSGPSTTSGTKATSIYEITMTLATWAN